MFLFLFGVRLFACNFRWNNVAFAWDRLFFENACSSKTSAQVIPYFGHGEVCFITDNVLHGIKFDCTFAAVIHHN